MIFMPYEVFLALRYFRSRHKRRLARATSVAAMLGICMGVAALIVALALANGFRDEMKEKILQGTAHLSVHRTDGQPIENYAELVKRLKEVDGVVSASATTYDGALVRTSNGSGYAVIRGIEKEAGDAVVRRWLFTGSVDPLFEAPAVDQASNEAMPRALIGAEMASRLQVENGGAIQILPANDPANARRWLRVAGIFQSGMFEYDSNWIFVGLDTAQQLSGGTHAASTISVQLNDPDNVKPASVALLKVLPSGHSIIDWQQANQPLFSALALERRMGLFIIGLIIAMATLNITTMLILVVVERRRDIAILRALGATRKGVMLVFVIEGAVVGAIGAVAGVAIGFVACLIGNYFKLVSLPADVYSISNVPLIAKPEEMLLAALAAFVLSVLATIYPARAASRLRPVEALRDS
jgi:lipoprotein-releasing system permease protein